MPEATGPSPHHGTSSHPKEANTYLYVSLGVTSQGVLSQSSATWTSTISCSSSELDELFEPLPQNETHLRAGGLGELRGETGLRMRQPFMMACMNGDPGKEEGRAGEARGTERERERERRKG